MSDPWCAHAELSPRQLPSRLWLILWIFIYRDADFTGPPHRKVCHDPFNFVGRGSHFSVKFKRNLVSKWCGFTEEWIWSHTHICFLLLFCLRLFHFLRWCSKRSRKWGFSMSNFTWFCIWKYWCLPTYCTPHCVNERIISNSNIKESPRFLVLQEVFNHWYIWNWWLHILCLLYSMLYPFIHFLYSDFSFFSIIVPFSFLP